MTIQVKESPEVSTGKMLEMMTDLMDKSSFNQMHFMQAVREMMDADQSYADKALQNGESRAHLQTICCALTICLGVTIGVGFLSDGLGMGLQNLNAMMQSPIEGSLGGIKGLSGWDQDHITKDQTNADACGKISDALGSTQAASSRTMQAIAKEGKSLIDIWGYINRFNYGRR